MLTTLLWSIVSSENPSPAASVETLPTAIARKVSGVAVNDAAAVEPSAVVTADETSDGVVPSVPGAADLVAGKT